ncbi:hypothetical protein [Deinococcus sp.]|uniref:hypothetical protein n=1 Tax=Deinococcus sp. TaxID=47478 RepID=UPI003B5B0BD6
MTNRRCPAVGQSGSPSPAVSVLAPRSLLTLFGAEHGLGGVHGYNQADTSDERPERVALIQRLTWAYLRSAFSSEDTHWAQARAALEQQVSPLGQIGSK